MTTTAKKLPVDTGATAIQMATTMFGDGITVLSASFSGDAAASGIYSEGIATSPGVVPADSGVILSTGKATDFTNASGEANKREWTSTNLAGGIDRDDDMNAIAGMTTYDAAFFEASFVPTGDTLTMQLVFSSEEYLEYVHSGFNDAVGVWVNGQKVELTIGDGDISIDNINTGTNANLFRDNKLDSLNTEMDGVTVTLTLKASVIVGLENKIKIGIADAGDGIYDSALLVVANGIQTALIAKDDTIGVTSKGTATVDLLANDTIEGREGAHISHINDQAITIGAEINLSDGSVLMMNEDGTLTITTTSASTEITFAYTISDASGASDVAFVTVVTDPVDGTESNDCIMLDYVDADGNMIDGSDGLAEVVMGYGGNDKIFTGKGDDDVYGGEGNDFIRAHEGDDLLFGGEGRDVLDGGVGADTMDGGAGDDIYYVDEAADTVIETGGGRDKVMSRIDYTLADTLEHLWLIKGSAAAVATGNGSDNMLVGNQNANLVQGLGGRDAVFGMDGDDTLDGGAGDDRLYAGKGNDLLKGGTGRDKLYGQLGSNRLEGGQGNDQLTAGKGGDVLVGGQGNDIMGAGIGADTFVFTSGDGVDAVKHFEIGNDRLSFEGVDTETIALSAYEWGAILRYGDDDRIIMRGVDTSNELSIDDFLLV
ncbi:MAG: choice-of-anchor L domain-containing protein [Pseudomonadota bacterium]